MAQLHPTGDKVVVKAAEAESSLPSGLIIPATPQSLQLTDCGLTTSPALSFPVSLCASAEIETWS